MSEYNDIDDEELIDSGLHNLLFNLKKNEFSFQPLYSEKYYDTWAINGLIPNKFSRWFKKLIEKGNMTIGKFINYIKEKYGFEISLILSAEDYRNIYEKINLKKNQKRLEKIKDENDKIKNSKLEYIYFQSP